MQKKTCQLCLAVIAMSLGWGLRGTIGGGELGAMIPGAMLGLTLGWFLGLKQRNLALLTVGSALGFGQGGAETYGQTIGLLRNSETAAWGMLGLTLKGAHWGLCAAVYLWVADRYQTYRFSQVAFCFALILAGQLAGWWFVNHPKLIYFSDPVNKPREELWFGLILGPFLGALFLSIIDKSMAALRFALFGFLSGAAGFGLGSLWLLVGMNLPEPWNRGPWWKCMEFSFGAILGAGFYFMSSMLGHAKYPFSVEKKAMINPGNFAAGVLVVFGTVAFQSMVPHRMPYQFLAPVLFLLVLAMPGLTWHVALSLTVSGFFIDLLEKFQESGQIGQSEYPILISLIIVLLVAAFVEWLTAKRASDPKVLLLILTFLAVGDWAYGQLQFGREGIAVPLIFIIETFALCFLVLRCQRGISDWVPTD